MSKPILGITMGDPASIGPEITVKALSDPAVYEKCRPLVVGDAAVMEAAVNIAGRPNIRIRAVKTVKEAEFAHGVIDVLDLSLVDMGRLAYGKISVMAGNAAFQYVKRVIELAMAGEVDATVTNALNKEAINLAGHHYSGHTEIYAAFTGVTKYTMMLAYQNLRVVHVSTHVSLKRAVELTKKDRILEVIHIADRALKDMGIKEPRIGVAGLNPHCGEGGLFGTEEIGEILPAVLAAKAEGILADGPIPADTLFSKARGGWYDVVVAMYHDQGHIPLKVLGFVYDPVEQKWQAVEGVNITLGLPIIRTSVDHGTAFDQAGKGTANELSLKNAIAYAVRFAVSKQMPEGI
jgi:4-hydroxythreonine-4-phosphate dehydrogenase